MNAKEYLGRANKIHQQISFDLKELEYWKELSTTISGCNFEENHNPNKNTETPFIKCLLKIKDLEERINNEKVKLQEIEYKILDSLDLIDSIPCRNILVFKYLKHMTWGQIAEELNYSQRWVYRLHNKALKAFEKVIKN